MLESQHEGVNLNVLECKCINPISIQIFSQY